MSQWVLPTSPAPPVVQSASGVGMVGETPDNRKRAREMLGSMSPSGSGSRSASNASNTATNAATLEVGLKENPEASSGEVGEVGAGSGTQSGAESGAHSSPSSSPSSSLPPLHLYQHTNGPSHSPLTPTPHQRTKPIHIAFTASQYHLKVHSKRLPPNLY